MTRLPNFFTYENKLRVLQWNIRGINSNQNDLERIVKIYKPDVVCIQEARIHYKIERNSEWNNYTPHM